MTIYLDAIWILNFFLDLMLLMLTQTLAKDGTRKSRIVFGAFIASLLVPISLYFPETFITSVVGKVCYSILIILCTFKFHTVYKMMKLLLLFYFTTFAIGGGLFAIHFLFQNPISLSSSGFLTFNSGYGDPISWLFIIIGFPIIWVFTKRRMDKHAVEKIRYDQLCPVTIKLKGKSYSTTGYIDSGNQLVDPLTKSPVIICDELYLKQWFADEDWHTLKDAYTNLDFNEIPEDWRSSIHIIPFHGVEGRNNFLLAIKPDELTVFYQNNKIITSKVLIGIQFASLTKDHAYHCLIQPEIIKLGTVYSA